MNELQQYIALMLKSGIQKIIISNPATKSESYKKIVIDSKKNGYQIAKYTEKQVFHENIKEEELEEKCLQLIENYYRQVNGISADKEHIILISKKGKCNYKVKKIADDKVKIATKENTVAILGGSSTIDQRSWGGLDWWLPRRLKLSYPYRFYPLRAKWSTGLELWSRALFFAVKRICEYLVYICCIKCYWNFAFSVDFTVIQLVFYFFVI